MKNGRESDLFTPLLVHFVSNTQCRCLEYIHNIVETTFEPHNAVLVQQPLLLLLSPLPFERSVILPLSGRQFGHPKIDCCNKNQNWNFLFSRKNIRLARFVSKKVICKYYLQEHKKLVSKKELNRKSLKIVQNYCIPCP